MEALRLYQEAKQASNPFNVVIMDLRMTELPGTPLAPNVQRAALERTKSLLRWRSHWMALAILFTAFPMSCAFDSHGIVWMMWRDAPQFARTCLVIAVVCWIQYLRVRHKARTSGV